MKRAEKVYRDAAKLIELDKENFACYAIAEALGVSKMRVTKEVRKFEKVLKDSNSLVFYSRTSTGAVDPDFLIGTELGKSARAIGLLLMAELVKENNPVLRIRRASLEITLTIRAEAQESK